MGVGTWLLRIAAGVCSVSGAALVLLYFFQEKLLYVPKIPGVPDDYNIPPQQYGIKAEDVNLTTPDGKQLHAWMLTLPEWNASFIKSRPVILFFQENAGNMSFRLPFLKLMMVHLQCPVFAVSYRGYGLSSGQPNEAGLKVDAQTGLDALLQRPDINSEKVVVYGRSLGGAVAIHLTAANKDKIKALIIENTFTCVEDMVSRVLPALGAVIGPGKPGNFLVTNKWYNKKEIQRITDVPMLMVVSELDEMVPADQMRRLYALQRAAVCSLVEIPGARHMDAYDVAPSLYWASLRMFMDKNT